MKNGKSPFDFIHSSSKGNQMPYEVTSDQGNSNASGSTQYQTSSEESDSEEQAAALLVNQALPHIKQT